MTDASLTAPRAIVRVNSGLDAFIDRIGRLPVRDWLAGRDSARARGDEIARAIATAELAVRGSGRIEEYRTAERDIMRLVDGIEWFALNSGGVHGITLRDIAAMRLLATWAALAVLMHDRLERDVVTTLVRPFASCVGLRQ